jgi:hypothetical protein
VTYSQNACITPQADFCVNLNFATKFLESSHALKNQNFPALFTYVDKRAIKIYQTVFNCHWLLISTFSTPATLRPQAQHATWMVTTVKFSTWGRMGVAVQLRVFLTLALHGWLWSASSLRRLIPAERPPVSTKQDDGWTSKPPWRICRRRISLNSVWSSL